MQRIKIEGGFYVDIFINNITKKQSERVTGTLSLFCYCDFPGLSKKMLVYTINLTFVIRSSIYPRYRTHHLSTVLRRQVFQEHYDLSTLLQ